MSRNIRIEYSGVDVAALSATTRGMIAQVVAKTALDIQAKAQEAAPVDTGTLKNSIYAQIGSGPVLLRQGAGKGKPGKPAPAAATPAAPNNPDLPDVIDRTKPVTAEVGTATAYAESVEFGTVKHPAEPYLSPAVEGARQSFTKALASVLDGGGK